MLTKTMTLRDVRTQEQFPEYYTQNNLRSPEEKISKLREEMKITAIRGEKTDTSTELLSVLEEAALLGYWRAS